MSFKLVAQSIWENPGNEGKRIRKSLAAVGWQLQKRLLGSTRQLTLPNGVRFKAYPDCVVSSALIYSDWPEYHELMFARSLLRRGDAVLDVGAYVGHVSLLLADVVGPENLFAFEPTPVSFDRLAENWSLNGWEDDRLFQIAVGANSGQAQFEEADQPNSMASMSHGGEIKVPLRPLDSFRDQWRDRPVGFLKIDVEGYEAQVFRGGMPFFAKIGPGSLCSSRWKRRWIQTSAIFWRSGTTWYFNWTSKGDRIYTGRRTKISSPYLSKSGTTLCPQSKPHDATDRRPRPS